MKASMFFFIFFAQTSFAYTPPNGFILNQTLQERASVKELYLEAKVTDSKTNAIFKEKLQLDFQAGKLTAVFLSPADELVGAYQVDLKEVHRLGKFWVTVALDPNGLRFKKALEELNALPREKSVANLTRFGSRVLWSWGDETRIDFYKDEFLPARYHTGTGVTEEQVYIKEYTSAGAAVRAPKLVEINSKNQDVFQYELKSMKVNSAVKLVVPENIQNTGSVQNWINLVR